MPTFYILQMDVPETPPILERGAPLSFTDGAQAAAYARDYGKLLGRKLCAKIQNDPEWKTREHLRMRTGEYKSLPWCNDRFWVNDTAYAVWKDHFPHPSVEKPGWLAYTKNEEDGARDKRSLVRPGSYLDTYFKHVMDMHNVSSQALAEKFMAMYGPVEVKFAETEADIIRVYNYGPDTCMKGKQWPGDGRNPAFIYAAGDLQVAYLGDLHGQITARTLVWPAKKTFSRVYGDIAKITVALNRLGYKWGAPLGARLQRVPLKAVKFDPRGGALTGCFVAPYIDKLNQRGGGHLAVVDKGDHLIVCEAEKPGSHHCSGADGRSNQYVPADDEYPTFTCERCQRPGFREVLTVYVDEEHERQPQSWCPACTGHAYRCGYSDNYYDPKKVPPVQVSERSWNPYYARLYAKTCEMTQALISLDHGYQVHFADGAKWVSKAWTRNNGSTFVSEISGRRYMRADRACCYNSYSESYYCGKAELSHHAFQCDGCKLFFEISLRHQSLGNDKLFCEECDAKVAPKAKSEGGKKKSGKKKAVKVNPYTFRIDAVLPEVHMVQYYQAPPRRR